MELTNIPDMKAFKLYIENLMKNYGKSYGPVATGAEIVNNNGSLTLVWSHSREPVNIMHTDLFQYSYIWRMVEGNRLFFEPYNFNSAGGDSYYKPPFQLRIWLYDDSSFEFVCMKEGDETFDLHE